MSLVGLNLPATSNEQGLSGARLLDPTWRLSIPLPAGFVQAAATGERETIMDEELARLAKKNLSKFQQLNQRMQARRLSQNCCYIQPQGMEILALLCLPGVQAVIHISVQVLQLGAPC